MVKLVYTYALGAYGAIRGGSSPLSGTFLLHYFMWILFFLLFCQPIFAQNSTTDLFNQYRSDYFYQRDLYQNTYQNYLSKKNTYEQYQTVTAETELTTATKETLISQNLTLKAYLMALRVTIPQNPELQNELQQQENWLSSQEVILTNLSTVHDFKIWAENFQKKYISIQVQIYTALLNQRTSHLQTTLIKLQNLAKNSEVDWGRNYQDKETQFNNFIQQAQDKTKVIQHENRFNNFYPQAIEFTNSAKNILNSIRNDLKSTLIKKQSN